MEDTSSKNEDATIAQFIKKIFVVSDNDAFNRLYEFLGQDYFNQRMWDLGYSETRVRHRLSIPLTAKQNKYTNSFSKSPTKICISCTPPMARLPSSGLV